MLRFRVLVVSGLLIVAVPALAQLYPNSVVSNEIDFITSSDPSSYGCTQYVGTDRKEMPDKRGGPLFQDGAFVFDLRFRDGTSLEVWVSRMVGNKRKAAAHVHKVTSPLGKLPTVLRREIDHVVIHAGNETAFSEDAGHFFVLYTENMDRRIRTHDLEETVFHEAMHASVQYKVLRSRKWKSAVRKDPGFVTDYARTNAQEDFAESALFAYTYLRNAERLPRRVREQLPEIMPNRLEFFRKLFPSRGREFTSVGRYNGCS